jgi:Flp pilus assembly CpaE family ATPase
MRTLVAVPDQALNQELTTALGKFPEIELVRQIPIYPEPDDFLRIIRARKPDFVFLSTEDFPKFQALAAVIDDRMPGLPVISVAREVDPIEVIPKLMHLGVRELLASPITHQKLGETIASIAQQLAKHPSPVVRLGDIYAFFPAKPGVGSSTISVSTSCALADELHVRTLLLDCDLMAGVTKFLLKLGASSSIVNALEHADTLDEDMWSQMVGHWDGLEVLHAGELAPPATLTSASLEVVLGFARGFYDTICADLASSLDPFTIQIMHEARRIFMVTTPELVPLYMAADRLKHLKDLGLADKVSLLLNRKNPAHRGLSDNEASQLVGLPIAHRFSNDYPGVQDAILDGVPISHRSSLGQSIMTLARSLTPAISREDAPPAHHRKFLEFFHVPSTRDHETVWRD